MNIRVIIIIAIAYLYFILEFIMALRQRKKSGTVAAGDKGSLRLLYFSIALGYFISFSIGAGRNGRIYHWDLMFAAGLLVLAGGLIIRINSIRTLNRFFTYSVTLVQNQEIIETGLYKVIRHPGYLGQIIIFFGISLMMSNYLAVPGMLIPVFCGYYYRIRIEEKFMTDQFGEKYIQYIKRTDKLLPKIY